MVATQRDKQGRHIARREYIAQPCEVCGKVPAGRGSVDRHHRNGDRMDNTPQNIQFLCRQHHMDEHQKFDGMVGGGPRPRINALRTSRAVEGTRQLRKLLAAGVAIEEAATRLGVHTASAYRWLRKYPA